MTAPLGADLDLQIAMVATLRSSTDLTSLIDTRIYQDVPGPNPVFPYVTVGENNIVDDSASCLVAGEHYPIVHVWSRQANGSFREAKQIADAIKKALHYAGLDLAENDFDLIEFHRADVMRDPDGVTKHVALTFRALINEPQGA